MPQLIPDLIIKQRYQLQRPLGRGGFSIVWLALDLTNGGKPVALKFSLPEKDPTGEQPLRMEKEHDTTKSLQYKHLLCSRSFFTFEDSGCLVFDYMAGGTLHNQVKLNGVLPEKEIAKVVQQIGSALHYLHEHALVHFDIKPENILIDSFGDYYLSDFDTASRLENSMVRVSRIYADTPQYRSPEHLRGAAELSEKIDIFAFGTTVFEMCEGIMEKEYGIGTALLGGLPKPNFHGKYAKRLENLVHACWNHNPSDRPTADALVSYANHLLNKKFWPQVIEYKPNDKPIAGPSTKNEGTARVTVGRQTVVTSPSSAPFVSVATSRLSVRESVNNFRASATRKFNKTVEKTQIMNPESPMRKWGLPIAGVLLILIVVFFIISGMINNYQFSAKIKEAEALKEQNILKEAYAQIQEAKKMRPSDSTAIKLRREILRMALEQHTAQLNQARIALKTKDTGSFLLIMNGLEGNKPNASILVGDDSTQFYIGKLKAAISLNPLPVNNNNTDWDEPSPSGNTQNIPVNNIGGGGNNNIGNGGNNPPNITISTFIANAAFGDDINPKKNGALGISSGQNRSGTDETDRTYSRGGSISITPKKKMQLTSAVLYTNDVGRAVVTISAKGESRTGKFRLTDGYNPLSFSDSDGLAGVVLHPGVTYSISVSLAATAGRAPQVENSANAASAPTSNSDFSINYSGNYFLYDLKYQAE